MRRAASASMSLTMKIDRKLQSTKIGRTMATCLLFLRFKWWVSRQLRFQISKLEMAPTLATRTSEKTWEPLSRIPSGLSIKVLTGSLNRSRLSWGKVIDRAINRALSRPIHHLTKTSKILFIWYQSRWVRTKIRLKSVIAALKRSLLKALNMAKRLISN